MFLTHQKDFLKYAFCQSSYWAENNKASQLSQSINVKQ